MWEQLVGRGSGRDETSSSSVNKLLGKRPDCQLPGSPWKCYMWFTNVVKRRSRLLTISPEIRWRGLFISSVSLSTDTRWTKKEKHLPIKKDLREINAMLLLMPNVSRLISHFGPDWNNSKALNCWYRHSSPTKRRHCSNTSYLLH